MYLLALFFFTAVSSLYLYVTRNHNYWKKRNVPHDEPKFFFGNMKDVMFTKVHLAALCADLYRKYKERPFCGYFKMMNPGIIVIDPELVKSVLIKDFFSFANNDFEVDPVINPIIGFNPFILRGELWRKVRGAWSHGLSSNRVRLIYDEVTECSKTMISHLERVTKEKPNEPYDAKLLLTKNFCDALSNSILKLKINSFEDPENSCMTMIQNVFQYSNSHGLKLMITFIMPWFGKLFKIGLLSQTSEKELMKMAKEIIADRKRNGFDKSNPLDYVMTYNGKTDVTEIEIAGLCFNLLFDGIETAAAAGGFTLYSIAANPDVQNKLHEELKQAIHGSQGKLTFDIIHNLPYLDMVISESLRMYPPLVSSQKVCTKDFETSTVGSDGKNVVIEKGTNVVVPIYGLHMDPDLFPEPNKFDPERFSEVNKDKIPKYAYIPFGEGQRMCLGMRLALNQIKIATVALVSNFELRLAPQMVGKEIVLDPEAFMYKSKDGLWITLHERIN